MSSGPEKLPGLSGREELYTFNICIPTWENAELYTCTYFRDTDMYL